jgi:hypothetical protein
MMHFYRARRGPLSNNVCYKRGALTRLVSAVFLFAAFVSPWYLHLDRFSGAMRLQDQRGACERGVVHFGVHLARLY